MLTLSHLSPALPVSELLKAPRTREVLDRYGLQARSAPLGAHDSIEHFAQAHDIPLEQLLAELDGVMATKVPPVPSRSSADALYRPFFLTAIAVVLTLGAVWGAYLLIRIALAGRFSAAGLHEVNAHGHAQIFGWVGLFVMGFAYQAFPRFKQTTLRYPAIAWLSFYLMTSGLITRSLLEPAADGLNAIGTIAVAASAIEVVAAGLFAFVIVSTWRTSVQRLESSDWYIASALFWFVVQSVGEAVYFMATLSVPPGELVPLVATWQGALRDLQIHGFATLMVLGVGQRILPRMFGFRVPSRRLCIACLIGLNIAVIGESAGLVLMRLSSRAWAGLWYFSVWLFLGCVIALIWNGRVFGRVDEWHRSRKFVRAAHAWLLVSLTMLVALPVYQFAILSAINPESAAVKMGFSHAFYGATRHAITVGFLSLMIVGVSSRVVPIFRGVDPRWLTQLWLPFILLNVGCALRVFGQIATDFADWMFPITGVSGVLEVSGLAIWGAHLVRLMIAPPNGKSGSRRQDTDLTHIIVP